MAFLLQNLSVTERTRARILQAAVKVFTRDGYSGGRVDTISTEADSNNRLI